MRKSWLIFLILLLVLLGVGLYFLGGKNSSTSVGKPIVDEGGVVRQDPSGATFIIDGENIKLVDGKNKTKIAPESSFIEETSLLDKFAYGDLNSDGKEDTALLLVRYGAGSGTFVYLAVYISGPVTYHGSNAIFLGDRISPETISIKNGVVSVKYLDRKLDEPMVAEPTISVTREFIYKNGSLQEK